MIRISALILAILTFAASSSAIANPVHFAPAAIVEIVDLAEAPIVQVAAGECVQARPLCGVYVPPGENDRGTKNMPLKYWVLNCHPDYRLLNTPRHWPYVMTTSKGLGHMISKIMARPHANHEGVVTVRQECRKQYYMPGWRAVTVSPCRIPGKEVFLVTRPLTAADHGRTLSEADWLQTQYMF